MKKCSRCFVEQPLTNFTNAPNSKDGKYIYCNSCRKIIWKNRPKDKLKEQNKQRQLFRKKYIDNLGGQCYRCGYNECIGSLDFHHLKDKKHSISALLSSAYRTKTNENIRRFEDELSKCIILCSNCHKALHFGIWSL